MVLSVLQNVGQLQNRIFTITLTSLSFWCISGISIILNHITLAIAQGNITTLAPDDDSGGLDKDAILGLALGFGFFIATTVCCCVTWCVCCKALSDPEKRKIMPLQFRTADRIEMPREDDSPDFRRR